MNFCAFEIVGLFCFRVEQHLTNIIETASYLPSCSSPPFAFALKRPLERKLYVSADTVTPPIKNPTRATSIILCTWIATPSFRTSWTLSINSRTKISNQISSQLLTSLVIVFFDWFWSTVSRIICCLVKHWRCHRGRGTWGTGASNFDWDTSWDLCKTAEKFWVYVNVSGTPRSSKRFFDHRRLLTRKCRCPLVS